MNGSTVSFAPLVAWPVLAALLGIALLPVLLAIARRARGAWLRLLFAAIIGAVLANPSLVSETRTPIRDVALIAVDRSQSQNLGDRTVRADAALAMLRGKLNAFPDLDTRVVDVGADSAVAGETDAFGPVEQAVSDVPRDRLAGIILLTDGEVHDVPAHAEDLKTLGPVHTLLTGSHGERDRHLVIVDAPAYGIVGKDVQVTIRVEDTKNIGAETATIRYSQDGADPQSLDVPVGQDTAVDVPLNHEGRSIVAFEAESAGDELTLANNSAAVAINAVRDRLKVLLVSGEPYPGERTWRNLLKGDPSVDLVHFTILRSPEKQQQTPTKELSLIAFPIRELFVDKLDKFDLIIFDRYEQGGILQRMYYQNIVNYVEQGGALLDASGPVLARPMSLYHTPLGEILPSTPNEALPGRFRPEVTPLGRRHPVIAGLAGAGLEQGAAPSWGSWFGQTDVTPKSTNPAETAVVMSGLKGRPLLMLSHVGQGRVAQLTSDQIWLWARGFDGGGPYAELMKRLAHWLMKEPNLEEDDLRARVEGDKLIVERVSLAPANAPATVTAPSGANAELPLKENGAGLASGSVQVKETGVYKVSDGKHTAFAIAGSLDAREFLDVLTTDAKLKPVAEATGGSIHWLEDEPNIDVRRVPAGRAMSGRNWIGLASNGQYTVSGVKQVSLIPPLLVLVLALATIVWGWRREGR